MYLHLGSDTVVNIRDIVGIFDMDNTTVAHQTRSFLAKAQKDGIVTDVTEDLPKSFVITQNGDKTRVFISSLAPRTLFKRTKTENIII